MMFKINSCSEIKDNNYFISAETKTDQYVIMISFKKFRYSFSFLDQNGEENEAKRKEINAIILFCLDNDIFRKAKTKSEIIKENKLDKLLNLEIF